MKTLWAFIQMLIVTVSLLGIWYIFMFFITLLNLGLLILLLTMGVYP